MNNNSIIDNFTPILLCGGKGKRLLKKTKTIPKPLIIVAGKPILKHILIELKNEGFKECIIAIGHLGEIIKEKIGSSYKGIKISYSDSGDNAGMLERVYNASKLTEKNMYVTYGDTFTKVDWKSIKEINSIIADHIIILTSKVQNPFGIVKMNQNMIVKNFSEKPIFDYYIGHFFCSKYFINNVKKDFITMKDGEGLVEWFKNLIDNDMLYAHSNKGLQITFNTYTELEEAKQRLSNYFSINEY